MSLRLFMSSFSLALVAQAATAETRFDREIAPLTDWLEVREGAVVADIGAGDREYAIALSRKVGDAGMVYATELDAADRWPASIVGSQSRRRSCRQVEF